MSELSELKQALRPPKTETPKLIRQLHAWLSRNPQYAALDSEGTPWVSHHGLQVFFAMRNESAETAIDAWKRERKVRESEHLDGLGQAYKLPEP